MGEHGGLPFFNEIVLFLVLAGVLIPLLERLRINQVLSFLVLGALLGPYGLGAMAEEGDWFRALSFPRPEGVSALAEFGVIFLLFMLGLELSLERLWAMRRWVFGVGSLQLFGSALFIGLVAYAFGNDGAAALVLGAALAFSSTAVVIELLNKRRELASPLGRAAFSILLFQDMAVVPLLILVGVLAAGSEGALPVLLFGALAKGLLVVGAILLVGRRLLRPVFHIVCTGREAETFIALTLLCILGIASLTWAAGLSAAMGAFLAGMLLAETEYRHEVQVTIEPFKGLLMGLFFMSVGMGIDLKALLDAGYWLPLSVIGLYAFKGVLILVLLRTFGLSWGRSWEGGLLLGQSGEFAFVVIGVALTGGLLDQGVGQFMLLVVGVTLFLTPPLARVGRHLGEVLQHREDGAGEQLATPEKSELSPLSGHVIVAGCGRVGTLVLELLEGQGVSYVGLDRDPRRVSVLREAGFSVFTGDASHPELLRRCQVGDAAAVVVTVDQAEAAVRAVAAVRLASVRVRVVARARDQQHAQGLQQAGADLVIPETLETGLQLVADVLDVTGVPQPALAQLIERERAQRIGGG